MSYVQIPAVRHSWRGTNPQKKRRLMTSHPAMNPQLCSGAVEQTETPKYGQKNQTSSFYFKVLFNIHKAPMFYSLKSGETVSPSGRCPRV